MKQKMARKYETVSLHDDLLKRIANVSRLESWNDFIEEIKVPADIYPALMSGRTELLRMMTPRELSKEDCAALFKVLAVLIETNVALREHAALVARLTKIMSESFRAVHSAAEKIDRFANFNPISNEEDQTESEEAS